MEIELVPLTGSVEKRIAQEQRQELLYLHGELSAMREVMGQMRELVGYQGTQLDAIEGSTETSQQSVEHAADTFAAIECGVKKKRRINLWAGVGAATGAGVGSLGFILGPPVGIVTMVVCASAGFASVQLVKRFVE